MRKPFMTSQATRRDDIANRATVGAVSLRGKTPVCVEITPKTRVGNGAVKMCKQCFGTSPCFHMAWESSTCADCGSLNDKIGGYWLLKRS